MHSKMTVDCISSILSSTTISAFEIICLDLKLLILCSTTSFAITYRYGILIA